MISITHYEVYTDKGDGWKLEERFSSEQRYEAINLAKEKETEKFKVKIIKEIFDVQDNTYQESVEYISNPNKKKQEKEKENIISSVDIKEMAGIKNGQEQQKSLHLPNVFKALLKLIAIIILCLVIANVLITLLVPIIKEIVPEEILRPILFGAFFILFLSTALPLVLKKVPWNVFVEKREVLGASDERRFLSRAEAIYKLYNLNDDFDLDVTPVYPEAPFEYKQYIISFLRQLLAQLESKSAFQDSFSKLGVKLIVYGGCLELSGFCGLRISEANSLLYEAFKVLEGENVDLASFYEAKRGYKDNKLAIFLSGIGACLMYEVINDQPLDTDALQAGFAKWEALNSSLEENEAPELKTDSAIIFSSVVNIKSSLRFLDESSPEQEEFSQKVSGDIHNIISGLLGKYNGTQIMEEGGITSARFLRLNEAVKFSVGFLKDISLYQDEVNDDTVFVSDRLNLSILDSR